VESSCIENTKLEKRRREEAKREEVKEKTTKQPLRQRQLVKPDPKLVRRPVCQPAPSQPNTFVSHNRSFLSSQQYKNLSDSGCECTFIFYFPTFKLCSTPPTKYRLPVTKTSKRSSPRETRCASATASATVAYGMYRAFPSKL